MLIHFLVTNFLKILYKPFLSRVYILVVNCSLKLFTPYVRHLRSDIVSYVFSTGDFVLFPPLLLSGS